MMPGKTPEEKARLGELLEQEQPAFDLMREDSAAQARRWEAEIAMLERRVHDEIAEVDLGNGDSLLIRACISGAEGARIQALEKERKALDREADAERLDEIAYEILEIVTANPMITAEWLRTHKDQYSVVDMLAITMGWYTRQINRAGEIAGAESFREERPGTVLRHDPEKSRDR